MPPPIYISPEDIGESLQGGLVETPLKALGRETQAIPVPNIVASVFRSVVKLDYVFGKTITGNDLLGLCNSALTLYEPGPGNLEPTILCENDGVGGNCLTDVDWTFPGQPAGGLIPNPPPALFAFGTTGLGGLQYIFSTPLKFPGATSGAFRGLNPFNQSSFLTLQAIGSTHNGEEIIPAGCILTVIPLELIDLQDRQIWPFGEPQPKWGGIAVYPQSDEACLCFCPALIPGVVGFHDDLGGGMLSPATSAITNAPPIGTANDDDFNQKASNQIPPSLGYLSPFPIYFNPGEGPNTIQYNSLESSSSANIPLVPYNYATTTGQVIVLWPGYTKGALPKIPFSPSTLGMQIVS